MLVLLFLKIPLHVHAKAKTVDICSTRSRVCRKYCEKKEFPVPNPNPWASLPRLIPHNKIDNNVELKTRANVNYVGIIHIKKEKKKVYGKAIAQNICKFEKRPSIIAAFSLTFFFPQ